MNPFKIVLGLIVLIVTLALLIVLIPVFLVFFIVLIIGAIILGLFFKILSIGKPKKDPPHHAKSAHKEKLKVVDAEFEEHSEDEKKESS